MSEPEYWLRGAVDGVPALLQPAAHALLQVVEDTEAATAGLDAEQILETPGGAASLAFHLMHVAGATDRLLAYARGERLNAEQRQALAAEASVADSRPSVSELLEGLRRGVERALDQLRRTDPSTLTEARTVGRAALPSTVGGLLFHAAEHASRHAGQIVTTARLVRRTPAA